MRIKHLKKGQSLVEMALLFPVFLLVVLGGLIDFGFAFYNFLSLQQLANDTAQWAAEGNGTIGYTDIGSIESFAVSRKPAWWQGGFRVETADLQTMPSGGRVIRVIMVYESPLYTPFYQTMFGAAGRTSIPLRVLAAYQIPNYVVIR